MLYEGQTAFITGGASGIARALTQRLVDQGARVFIADINEKAAQAFADELNKAHPESAYSCKCDVTSWDELTSAFIKALNTFERIDYVFPIAGLTERKVIPKPSESSRHVRKEGFAKPDWKTFDTNTTGMMNLILIAVQAFRNQDPNPKLGGMRGKIVCVASTCGLYAIPGVPVYVASKHAILGFARAYGEILPFENVTFNAICPHVVRTNISSSTSFYDELEKQGLMTDIQNVVAGFEEFLGTTDRSGQCFEVGPRASRVVSFMPYMDEETRVSSEAVMGRSGGLWKD